MVVDSAMRPSKSTKSQQYRGGSARVPKQTNQTHRFKNALFLLSSEYTVVESWERGAWHSSL